MTELRGSVFSFATVARFSGSLAPQRDLPPEGEGIREGRGGEGTPRPGEGRGGLLVNGLVPYRSFGEGAFRRTKGWKRGPEGTDGRGEEAGFDPRPSRIVVKTSSSHSCARVSPGSPLDGFLSLNFCGRFSHPLRDLPCRVHRFGGVPLISLSALNFLWGYRLDQRGKRKQGKGSAALNFHPVAFSRIGIEDFKSIC